MHDKNWNFTEPFKKKAGTRENILKEDGSGQDEGFFINNDKSGGKSRVYDGN